MAQSLAVLPDHRGKDSQYPAHPGILLAWNDGDTRSFSFKKSSYFSVADIQTSTPGFGNVMYEHRDKGKPQTNQQAILHSFLSD